MGFFDVAEQRYSVRAYRPDGVENEKLQRVLKAGVLAPTACNLQPFRLVVIRTREHLDALKKVCRAPFFAQAPVIIGIYADISTAWVRKDGKCYADVDAAIVMDHIILAATELGLGTCWIGAFDAQAARDFAGLGKGWEPVAFTPLGYPASVRPERQRKPLEHLVTYL
jgi:nitroreductase